MERRSSCRCRATTSVTPRATARRARPLRSNISDGCERGRRRAAVRVYTNHLACAVVAEVGRACRALDRLLRFLVLRRRVAVHARGVIIRLVDVAADATIARARRAAGPEAPRRRVAIEIALARAARVLRIARSK